MHAFFINFSKENAAAGSNLWYSSSIWRMERRDQFELKTSNILLSVSVSFFKVEILPKMAFETDRFNRITKITFAEIDAYVEWK